MDALINSLRHIVRVLSVPLVLAMICWWLYRIAAPPDDLDEDDGHTTWYDGARIQGPHANDSRL